MSDFKLRLRRLLSNSKDPKYDRLFPYNTNTFLKKDLALNIPARSPRKKKDLFKKMFSIDRFKFEKQNIPNLVRTCTLRDIHNYISSPSLSRSLSYIDIGEERRGSKIKKKIKDVETQINENRYKIAGNINRPAVKLNTSLYRCNRREIINISPISSSRGNVVKRTYIKYPDQFYDLSAKTDKSERKFIKSNSSLNLNCDSALNYSARKNKYIKVRF